MRESITGHAVFNDNQMTRQLDLRPVVIVESDADLSIIGPHLLNDRVRCAPGFSKSATLLAARLHHEQGDDWAIAFVDRDMDGDEGPNVIQSSNYDLEADVYFSNPDLVTRYVYRFLVSETLSHDAAVAESAELVSEAKAVAEAIGAVRLEAHRSRAGVSFANLPILEILRRAEGADVVHAATQIACLKASRMELAESLEAGARGLLSAGAQLRHICRGHDLLDVLIVRIGAKSGHRPRSRDFARGFHAIVDCSAFPALGVFAHLEAWFVALSGDSLWDCVA